MKNIYKGYHTLYTSITSAVNFYVINVLSSSKCQVVDCTYILSEELKYQVMSVVKY